MADLVTGDTGSVYQLAATDSDTGSVIDLTGAIVRLRWEDDAGAVQTRIMTVTNTVGGIAEYKFLTGEIIAPKMVFETEIEDSSGFITSSNDLTTLSVREELG